MGLFRVPFRAGSGRLIDARNLWYINDDRNQTCQEDLISEERAAVRVSKEKAKENHEQILKTASRLFREQGISNTGVDSITRDAGFTHGGLYSQFGSKEAIAAEAIAFAARRSERRWNRTLERNPGEKGYRAMVSNYLSRAHRDSPGDGCVLAALGADVARQPAPVRRAFTKALKDTIGYMATQVSDRGAVRRQDDAIAALACLVGALVLARAVDDDSFSDRILKSGRRATIKLTGGRRRVRRAR